MEDCVFIKNRARALNCSGTRPVVQRCTFRRNFSRLPGAGIFSAATDAAIVDCVFFGNESDWSGGGISLHGHGGTVRGCLLESNTAFMTGGGLEAAGGGVFVSDCEFYDNLAVEGGGVYGSGPVSLHRCRIEGNTADDVYYGYPGHGGGLSVLGWAQIRDCIIAGNQATGSGGGAALTGNIAQLDHCTIADNEAPEGGGVSCSGTLITNSILWGSSSPERIRDLPGRPAVHYSDLQGGWPGLGNIDADPLFVDAAAGDYHLLPGSPAINAGDPLYEVQPGETDIDGQPRVLYGRTDMGADEFWVTGDVNADGSIDVFDVLDVVVAFGSVPGDSNWRPGADFNRNGVVDVFDVITTVNNFGQCGA